jgi:hypothetical protein
MSAKEDAHGQLLVASAATKKGSWVSKWEFFYEGFFLALILFFKTWNL